MRVAIAHDWLTGMRGGEKVLEVLCELLPGADLFTLVHVPGSVSPVIENRPVHTTFLSRLPGIARNYRRFLPFFPSLIESFDLRGFDVVVSVSSCVAKGIRPGPGARHVSYVLSPMRYVWDRYEDYFGPGRAGLVTRAAMSVLRGPLQRWDRASAERVDVFVADSRFVRERIRRFYDREAEVVAPPVDTETFRPVPGADSGRWLVVSAFAPYKRLDLALRAAQLAGVPLDVIGKGPEEGRLRRLAGENVSFLGWVSNEELAARASACRGLLFPGVEDFGITPLEVMACGRPAIAYGAGGALETVVGGAWVGDPGGRPEGATGLFVLEQSAEAFAAAIRTVESAPDRFRPEDCRARALEFATDVFRRRLREGLERWTGLHLPAGERPEGPSHRGDSAGPA
jgi:glycosyltransferase involved in cell wall biosynthesis